MRIWEALQRDALAQSQSWVSAPIAGKLMSHIRVRLYCADRCAHITLYWLYEQIHKISRDSVIYTSVCHGMPVYRWIMFFMNLCHIFWIIAMKRQKDTHASSLWSALGPKRVFNGHEMSTLTFTPYLCFLWIYILKYGSQQSLNVKWMKNEWSSIMKNLSPDLQI